MVRKGDRSLHVFTTGVHFPVPPDDFHGAIFFFRQGGTVFDPITGIAISDAVHLAQGGLMDVAADNPVNFLTMSFGGHEFFKVGKVFDGLLNFSLDGSGEAPIWFSEVAADSIDQAIEEDQVVVGPTGQVGKPRTIEDHGIELITMENEEAAAVGGFMIGAVHNLDVAELIPDEIAKEFVVVTRD